MSCIPLSTVTVMLGWYIKWCLPYLYRVTPLPPGWGTWRESRHDTWAAQLKIITALTAQVDSQKAVVEVRDAAVALTQTNIDAAHTDRDAKQVALDLAHDTVDRAYEERGEMLAALEDEELYLTSLQSDLAFHTQRLRDTEPY